MTDDEQDAPGDVTQSESPASAQDMLAQAQAKIEQSVKPEMREAYDKIVSVGMHMAMKDGTAGILAQIKNSQDPVQDCALGALGLCVAMRKQSRGTMPLAAMVPASMTLMLKALAFVDRAGIKPITQEDIVRAARILADKMLRSFGIGPDQLKSAAAKAQDIVNDPVRMEKIQQANGFAQSQPAQQPQASPGIIGGSA